MSDTRETFQIFGGSRERAMEATGLYGQDFDDSFGGTHAVPDAIAGRRPPSAGESKYHKETGDSSKGHVAMTGAEIDFPPNVTPGIN